MDLIEGKAVAEQPPRLNDLSSERPDREILHLLDVGIEAPSANVGVPPLGSDDDVRGVACIEPRAEERFRVTVGSGDVEGADAGGVRRVEDLSTPSLHRRAGSFVPEVAVSPDV